MKEQIMLFPIPLDELISRLKSELLPAITNQQPQPAQEEEFLTAKQVKKFLGVSLVTIHAWKKSGKIKFHRFGSRVRFLKSEIVQVEKYKNKKER